MSSHTPGSQQLGSDGLPKSSWTALGRNSHSLKVTDAKAISDQDQVVAVHCHRYQWSKYTRSQRLGLRKLPSLAHATLESNKRRKDRHREDANSQFGVFGKDPAILIVSRRRQSEVESSTLPVRIGTFPFTLDSPERRGVDSNEPGEDSGLAIDAEVFSVGDVLECPAAAFFPGCYPLWRGIRIRYGR